jgi:hypothetical protein
LSVGAEGESPAVAQLVSDAATMTPAQARNVVVRFFINFKR